MYRFLLVLLTLVCSLSFCAGCGKVATQKAAKIAPSPSNTANSTATDTHIKVDASTLLIDLASNAYEANLRHQGKYYAVLGKISSIKPDGKSFALISAQPPQTYGNLIPLVERTRIICLLDSPELQTSLRTYRVGQEILVKGQITKLTETEYIFPASDIERPFATTVAQVSGPAHKEKRYDYLARHGDKHFESVAGIYLTMKDAEVMKTLGQPDKLLVGNRWYYEKLKLDVFFEKGQVATITIGPNSPCHLATSGLGSSSSFAQFVEKYSGHPTARIRRIAPWEFLFLQDLEKGEVTLSVYPN